MPLPLLGREGGREGGRKRREGEEIREKQFSLGGR
jgi:hypothetical protein